jgi:hypothetical protein
MTLGVSLIARLGASLRPGASGRLHDQEHDHQGEVLHALEIDSRGPDL